MDLFGIQIALSFIVGGLYIATSIRIAEAFGPKWGGLIIGLPSTSLVSFVFIGLTQDVQAVVNATPIVPLAFGVNALFVLAFVHLYRHGWKAALLGALLFWAAIIVPVTWLGLNDLLISLAGALVCIAMALHWGKTIPSRKTEKNRFSNKDFLFRAAFSGFIIASAVFLAKTQGPIWGGLMAGFPAAFLSSMLLLSRRHGIGFAASVAKSMPLGNLASIGFVLAAYVLLPWLGLWTGLLAAYFVSVGVGLLAQKTIAA